RPTDGTQFVQVDLSSLMQQAVQEVSRLQNVQVHAAIDDHAFIMANPVDITRIVNNLVENARRYGRKKGEERVVIDLACRVDGDRVLLEIADRGDGVPEEEIDRLLRPFTRMDQARGQANGAGLGLAIVDRFVRRHGGKLQLANRNEGGLMIRISFANAKKRH